MSFPTLDDMHRFLRRRYKADRFTGRDGETWGADYSMKVARSHLAWLQLHGFGFISRHESATGEAVKYTVADVLADGNGSEREDTHR